MLLRTCPPRANTWRRPCISPSAGAPWPIKLLLARWLGSWRWPETVDPRAVYFGSQVVHFFNLSFLGAEFFDLITFFGWPCRIDWHQNMWWPSKHWAGHTWGTSRSARASWSAVQGGKESIRLWRMNSLAAGHEVLQASGRPFPSWCPNMPRTHTKAYLGFDQSDHQCVVLLSNPFKNNKKRKNSKSWINLHGVKKNHHLSKSRLL